MSGTTRIGTIDLNGRAYPRIGYGMGGVTRSAGDPAGRGAALRLLQSAYDLGIRQLDTAHFYGDGLANRLILEALGEHRDELLIATKAGARSTPGARFPMTAAQKPAELRESVEVNLRTLGTDRLDLVYIRRMDAAPGLLAEGDQQVPLEDQLAELVALRDEGKVRGIGLSHVSEEQVRSALGAGILAVQNIFHLCDRHDAPLLELCRAEGIAWIPYFPLGGGFGDLPRVVDLPVVKDVARELGASPTQVGQAWLLHAAPNTVLISGTSNEEHLRQNVAAGDLELTDAVMRRLEEG